MIKRCLGALIKVNKYQLKEELLKNGVKVLSMELDLTQNDAPKELINKVTEQLGYFHILINNAAYSTNNDFSNLTAEGLDSTTWSMFVRLHC